jgi:hypothetical protein
MYITRCVHFLVAKNCQRSQKFAPEYIISAKILRDKGLQIRLAKTNDMNVMRKIVKAGVSFKTPAIKLLRHGEGILDYSGELTAKDLLAFLVSNTA